MSGLRTHARCATARRSNDLAARNAAADVASRGWPLFLADEECLLIGGVVGKVVDAAGAAVGHRTARQRVEVRRAGTSASEYGGGLLPDAASRSAGSVVVM